VVEKFESNHYVFRSSKVHYKDECLSEHRRFDFVKKYGRLNE